MEENQYILFFLSCFGVTNSTFLTFYFFFNSRKPQIQNRFLAGLFLVLSIRITKSIIFYFYKDTIFIELYLQIGLSACFLIGPFLYFYIFYFFKKGPSPFWWLQLILYIILITIISLLLPYMQNIEMWRNFILPIIHLQWFIYLLLTGRLIWQYRRNLNKSTEVFFNEKTWVISIFVGVSIIWLLYIITPLSSYILGAISFSFLIYILLFLLLLRAENFFSIGLHPIKYGGVEISTSEVDKIYEQVNQALEQNYQNEDLKLDDIAKLTEIRKHEISQVLNEHYNINFSSHLRRFRIQKVKKLIHTNHVYTLEAIGKECGFKAKSSFYTAFKKETNMTPLQYKKGLENKKV